MVTVMLILIIVFVVVNCLLIGLATVILIVMILVLVLVSLSSSIRYCSSADWVHARCTSSVVWSLSVRNHFSKACGIRSWYSIGRLTLWWGWKQMCCTCRRHFRKTFFGDARWSCAGVAICRWTLVGSFGQGFRWLLSAAVWRAVWWTHRTWRWWRRVWRVRLGWRPTTKWIKAIEWRS